MNACFTTKKDQAFIRNGGMVLEKLIALRNGKCNPIRGFSAKELKRATNNCAERQVLCTDLYYTLYKGFLQDRPIIVKTFEGKVDGHLISINEIAFASHMSVHKNVLKLLGCCLETEVPILVFESVKYGALSDHLLNPNNAHFEPLPWKHRLKIAVDIANVVAYLHTAFPRPIVHTDIKPTNILLDENYVAKLTHFPFSISIPDGETHVKVDWEGTRAMGYLAPELSKTDRFNEKTDVYDFGVCLLVLLTGKNPFDLIEVFILADDVKEHIEDNRFNEMVDPIIVGEGPWPGKEEELQSFAALALRCISETEDSRPAMTDVGKELRQICRSGISPI